MELINQFFIIFTMLFAGEFISKTFSIPIPGNVIGMVLLTICLVTKVIKIKQVEKAANLLLNNLAVFFICPAVGIIMYLHMIKLEFMAIMVPTIISIIIGLVVTGKVVQYIVTRKEGI
ncbi:CidA/LrgA family protein [Anaeromicrobium sediminis]|uniref:CidA/LrgA family protein n=1 Tax=Anaeromicrobium sediminis TaxID=1478221 RepID=A0A267MDM8_9FIRM|nr:CidA/LrgA family protein [Anaeromicrobium sediminis]PAB57659.1 hypothetical protein CCE28_18530 [Anaeromicrobium sediminis]